MLFVIVCCLSSFVVCHCLLFVIVCRLSLFVVCHCLLFVIVCCLSLIVCLVIPIIVCCLSLSCLLLSCLLLSCLLFVIVIVCCLLLSLFVHCNCHCLFIVYCWSPEPCQGGKVDDTSVVVAETHSHTCLSLVLGNIIVVLCTTLNNHNRKLFNKQPIEQQQQH